MHRRLFNARKENQLKQKELAVVLNISQSSYDNKEVGRHDFTLNQALTLAAIFDTSVDELFGELKEEVKEKVNDDWKKKTKGSNTIKSLKR